MDSDDEEEQMFAEFFEKEMAAAAQDEEHMLILALQKCTVAMRMLAYGAPRDSTDDYLRMAESTTFDCFYRFCWAVIAVFGDIYLRSPTVQDTAQILAFNNDINVL
jgi:hypothetical protein